MCSSKFCKIHEIRRNYGISCSKSIEIYAEAVVRRCSLKKMFLEISQNSQENTCARVSFLNNLPQACNLFKKESLVQVFTCEFYEISKNTFSYGTPPVVALYMGISTQNCLKILKKWMNFHRHFQNK